MKRSPWFQPQFLVSQELWNAHSGLRLRIHPSANTGNLRFSPWANDVPIGAWQQWEASASQGLGLFFLDLMAGLLLHPVKLLKSLGAGPWESTSHEVRKAFLLASLLSVSLVSFFLGAKEAFWSPLGSPMTKATVIAISLLGGVVGWFIVACLIAAVHFVFSNRPKLFPLLCTTGLAALPWLLLAPVQLLQMVNGTDTGIVYTIFCLVAVAIWGWSTWLFTLALKYSFGLNGSKLALLLGLPFGLGCLAFAWFLGFFATLTRLATVPNLG